jgi:hypothetical protein
MRRSRRIGFVYSNRRVETYLEFAARSTHMQSASFRRKTAGRQLASFCQRPFSDNPPVRRNPDHTRHHTRFLFIPSHLRRSIHARLLPSFKMKAHRRTPESASFCILLSRPSQNPTTQARIDE